MRGPPVVLTNTLGRPVTNVISERGAVPMTVVNTLGEPVTLVASGGEPVTLFNANGTLWDYPFSLFANNEQGAWYDPSDFSTLFQNSTGTTPVTAVEQPVRLMLDRSGRGNNATAPNDASRPVLRARYNLLTFSEQFDNAVWNKTASGTGSAPAVTANTAVAPDGTMTADTIVFALNGGLTSSDLSQLSCTVSALSGQATWAIYLKTTDGSAKTITLVAPSGILQSCSVTGSWQRFSVSGSGGTLPRLRLRGDDAVSDNASLHVWGAQLLTAADQTSTGGAYQRIAAATDYDVSNPVFRPYLAFDGSDDSLSTSAIDFSGTDEMTVFAGVTKLSDANDAMLVELSANAASNAGSFYIAAPEISGGNSTNVRFKNRGSLDPGLPSAATFAAPGTRVLRAYGDISGDTASVFLNGSSAATTTGDQGTGNYGNYPLFIGRRNNASLPLNGRLYSLAVLGRTATTEELSAMEAWVNGKTGAY